MFNNSTKTLKSLLLAGAALSTATLLASVANAQPADDKVEKVTVTGSRIPQRNLITTSPVSQVTAKDIKTSGVTRVEDLINTLPQVLATQNSTV